MLRLLSFRRDDWREERLFQVSKACLVFLSVIASLSIIYSCFYLRPLNWDGARIAARLFQENFPYWDNKHYRFIMVPTQIPVLAIINAVKDLTPQAAIIIYSLTLVIPFVSFFVYAIYRSKTPSMLICTSGLYLIGLLPGMTYYFSTIPETVVCFSLLIWAAIRKNLLVFFVTGLVCSFGHPLIIVCFGALVLITGLELLQTSNTRTNFMFISSLAFTLVVGVRIYISVVTYPHVVQPYSDYVQRIYLLHFGQSTVDGYQLCIGFCLILLLSLFRRLERITQVLWPLATVMVLFMIIRENPADAEQISHSYRLLTFISLAVISFYFWAQERLKAKAPGIYAFIFLIVGASWITIRELKLARLHQSITEEMSRGEINPSCYFELPLEKISGSQYPIPFFLFFLKNQNHVDQDQYVREYNQNRSQCSNLKKEYSRAIGSLFCFPNQSYVPGDGFFKIHPLSNREPR